MLLDPFCIPFLSFRFFFQRPVQNFFSRKSQEMKKFLQKFMLELFQEFRCDASRYSSRKYFKNAWRKKGIRRERFSFTAVASGIFFRILITDSFLTYVEKSYRNSNRSTFYNFMISSEIPSRGCFNSSSIEFQNNFLGIPSIILQGFLQKIN